MICDISKLRSHHPDADAKGGGNKTESPRTAKAGDMPVPEEEDDGIEDQKEGYAEGPVG